MNISVRRVRAIFRKELREYRRNRSVLFAMAILPLIFVIQPLVSVFVVPESSADSLSHTHLLLYMLGIPVLVPATLAAYAIAGERQQGTLEPALTTPISREEFVAGKALAVFVPSVAIALLVYAVFLGLVALFAHPSVAAALIQVPDVLAQIVFTPLLATVSIWVGLAISTRASDVRVAQQLSLLGSLPLVLVTSLLAFDVIHVTTGLAVAIGVALLLGDVLGWRVVAPLLDRERLITGSR
jgi:ABC-type transport system involved in multi-copper enzyme maturation permease subunit